MCIICDFADTFNTMDCSDVANIRIASPTIEALCEHLRIIADALEKKYAVMEGKSVMAVSAKSVAEISYDHISKQLLDKWRKNINEHKHSSPKEKQVDTRRDAITSGNSTSH